MRLCQKEVDIMMHQEQFDVTRGGTLNINGGSITATGPRMGKMRPMAALGTINMSGGMLKIVGDGKDSRDLSQGQFYTFWWYE